MAARKKRHAEHTKELEEANKLTQVEEVVLRAKSEWERTFDSMPDLIAILDTRHRIVRVNKAMAQRLGFRPEECIGLECFKCVHKLNMMPEFCPHARTLADGKEHIAEVHEDNLGGDFIVSTTPLFDQQGRITGAVHVARDITERKKAEAELTHLASFPELNPYPVIELEMTGNIKYINPSAKKLFPDMETMQSKHPFLKNWEALVSQLQSEPSQSIIRELRVGDSWYEQAFFYIPGESIRIYGRDITERKKVDQLKDEFISLVSHELRTPLTVVTGAVKTAMDERISGEERNQLLQDAALSTESLASILDNLLELSRYQADRLMLHKKAVSVAEVAEKTAQRIRQQYSTHSISLDIPSELPPPVVDPIRLERVLYNLMENAAKYSPEGSEVRVFAQQEGEGLVIGVSDHGAGIAPEDQQKIFEPFTRLGVEGKIKGIGLGLVVCKRLVEAHGGRIWVESKPGEGSTFLFTIPL